MTSKSKFEQMADLIKKQNFYLEETITGKGKLLSGYQVHVYKHYKPIGFDTIKLAVPLSNDNTTPLPLPLCSIEVKEELRNQLYNILNTHQDNEDQVTNCSKGYGA